MRHPGAPLLIGLAVASIAVAQRVPPELSALASKAGLDRPVAAWCRAEFRSGHPGAFAVAVTSAAGGGRYVILDSDASVEELAAFTRGPDLSCYSRAEAEKLNVDIRDSRTIQGEITPRWSTAVVCGFVDDTSAACWQYSPDAGAFVRIGGWVT